MGCDIHATLERKRFWPWETTRLGETGEDYDWVSAGYPFEDGSSRNYALFSALGQCGRNPKGQVSISERRGFPARSYRVGSGERFIDLSPEFERYYESWEDDAHGSGYATLKEIMAYDPIANGMPEDWMDRAITALDDLSCRMQRVAAEYDGDPEAVRIVFFFDN